jgi:fatty-acyl-CoA synthase
MRDQGFEAATISSIAAARRHSLGDLLRRSALRYPDKLAVIHGDVRLTFADFDKAVNRAAHSLGARGLLKGERVAILSHNCWQYGVMVFATARAGLVLTPINFMLGVEEVAFILQHSGASGFVVEEELVSIADQALALAGARNAVQGVIQAPGTRPIDGWENVDGWITGTEDPGEPGIEIDDDDPVRLMYTSGTESRPKGVMLSSRSLIAQYVSCIIDGGMTIDDIELHSLPMYHCGQLDCYFCVDIYLGATSIILGRPDPAEILATIEREHVTKLFCPPTVWIALLGHPAFDTTDLSSLRKGYYGASAMPVEVLRELVRRLPDVQLWNLYGQTEMAPLATILRPHEQLPFAGSAGRPSINVETRVVDDEDRPVAPGVVGEIVHRSPHAALGYYHDEEKTAAAFRNGWFHSGDLGVMSEDGYLSVVDRKKDMIKTGGENVASREVEEVLYQLDGVAEVAVFGISHPRWIEAVTAAVVPVSGAELTAEQVQAHARQHLAGFKCPKYVVLVTELPKNPSGKVLKRDLREAHRALAEVDSETAGASI